MTGKRYLPLIFAMLPASAGALTMGPWSDTMPYELTPVSDFTDWHITRVTFELTVKEATGGFITFGVPLLTTYFEGFPYPSPCPDDCAFTWELLEAGTYEIFFDLGGVPDWLFAGDFDGNGVAPSLTMGPAAIPEPGSAALFALGLLGLGSICQGRRSDRG